MALSPFVTKLSALVALTGDEKQALLALPFTQRKIDRCRDIISKGERPNYLYILLSGWAGRYSLRPDGSRRVTGFLLPGEFCGIHAVCNAPMDHAITALTDCTMARVELAVFESASSRSQAIVRGVWAAKLAEEATLRVWLTNSDQALRTLAHFICELDARLHPHDLANERRFSFPLTQDQIGDVLAITPVHTNRMLRTLREAGLVIIGQRIIHLPDVAALRAAASFDPGYLYASR